MGWPEGSWQRVEEAGLIAEYRGGVEATAWNRIPGIELK
jgi:hypothetical protein